MDSAYFPEPSLKRPSEHEHRENMTKISLLASKDLSVSLGRVILWQSQLHILFVTLVIKFLIAA